MLDTTVVAHVVDVHTRLCLVAMEVVQAVEVTLVMEATQAALAMLTVIVYLKYA